MEHIYRIRHLGKFEGKSLRKIAENANAKEWYGHYYIQTACIISIGLKIFL